MNIIAKFANNTTNCKQHNKLKTMREIKFRGKRVKYNPDWHESEWYFGNLLNECTIGEVGAGLDSYTYVEVDPKTVGQFTGLTDKNGVKVFEGDLIRHVRSYSFGDDFNGEPMDDDRTDTVIGRVVFYPTSGWVIVGKKTSMNDITGNFNVPNLKYKGLPSMISTYAEVIGNIHD